MEQRCSERTVFPLVEHVRTPRTGLLLCTGTRRWRPTRCMFGTRNVCRYPHAAVQRGRFASEVHPIRYHAALSARCHASRVALGARCHAVVYVCYLIGVCLKVKKTWQETQGTKKTRASSKHVPCIEQVKSTSLANLHRASSMWVL
eukprot:gene25646-biopygen3006